MELKTMFQTEKRIRMAHRKASSELEKWSGLTGDFFQLTFFGDEGFRGVVILRAPSLDSAPKLVPPSKTKSRRKRDDRPVAGWVSRGTFVVAL